MDDHGKVADAVWFQHKKRIMKEAADQTNELFGKKKTIPRDKHKDHDIEFHNDQDINQEYINNHPLEIEVRDKPTKVKSLRYYENNDKSKGFSIVFNSSHEYVSSTEENGKVKVACALGYDFKDKEALMSWVNKALLYKKAPHTFIEKTLKGIAKSNCPGDVTL